MTNYDNNQDKLQVVNQICAGIDVHRDSAFVTLLSSDDGILRSEFRKYKTTKPELLKLRTWLLENNCYVVGIESTGKYWYPVHNALSDSIQVLVYNARNMKNIVGKKTDKADSQWIASVTRHGMIMHSFIPSQTIRDSRLMVRARKSIVQERTSVRQRLHGVLDCCSIKMSSIVTDLYGVTGKNLLKLLISSKPITVKMIAQCTRTSLSGKVAELVPAMDGYVRPIHKRLIKKYLYFDDLYTKQIALIEADLYTLLIESPEKEELLQRIKGIPGFSDRSALLLLAEIGFDLSSFPTSRQFCSWAGLAPGRHESAGVNKSGRIQVRQRYVRSLLTEVAFAGIRSKNTFYNAKYHSLKVRTGNKKAVIAIAHKIAKSLYNIIKEGQDYHELSSNYLFLDKQERAIKSLRRIADNIGKAAALKYINNLPEDIVTT